MKLSHMRIKIHDAAASPFYGDFGYKDSYCFYPCPAFANIMAVG